MEYNIPLIFAWIWAAMITTSFWESRVEGRNAGHRKKIGLRIDIGGNKITSYHIALFLFMFPLLLSLPLAIHGWDLKLFGILLSAYLSGLVIEDFMWFVVNPLIKVKKDWNPKFVNYYEWFRIGKFYFPKFYVAYIVLSIAIWYFIWR